MRTCPLIKANFVAHRTHSGCALGVDRAPTIKEEHINAMFSTNVTGLINMTQAILPIMQSRGESGTGDIINIGSIAGREAYPGGSIYCATKAAVRSFTDALRRELISSRIRVMEIDPGQVETVCTKQVCYMHISPNRSQRSSQSYALAATKPKLTKSTGKLLH